ncbi:MAG: helix-turn-helix transcriptional regulator [Deltaproteobacteria bacterium]|nr:helix-turn-helix transcriptional regulator [Deltaproteobacteria bacterium]
MSTLGERIRYVRQEILKVNQAEFAKRLDFNRVATISDYEKDKRNPDITALRKISFIGGVKLDWLLTGSGPMSSYDMINTEHACEPRAAFGEHFVCVKVYDMLSAGGPDNFPGTDPMDSVMVPKKDYVKGPLALRVRGEAMAPNIHHDATVGVDVNDKRLISGDIYAVWLNFEGVSIKRVFIHPDKVVLKPDNPTFPHTAVYAGDLSTQFVIGKVVWLYQSY